MIRRYDCVTIGGGMVGLTLAAALAQGGRKVAVVESHPPAAFKSDDAFDLRVVAVNRASQNVLQNLGAWDKLRSMRAWPYEAMEVWDSAGLGRIGFSASEVGEADLGHIVESRVLQLALQQRVAELPGVDWLCPERVQRFMVDDQEAVVTLESGSLLMTPLIVGADGANSFVREMAAIDVRRNDYHQQAIVAAVRTTLDHEKTAWQRFQPDGVLAFLPMSAKWSSIVWSVEENRATELLALDEAEFRAALAQALDHRLGEVLECSARMAFPLRGGQASSYVKPRIALIGDAAHTIHPLAGQGVNLGFMDAAALAEVLLASKRDLGSLSLLRKYERARSGDNLLMQRLMEGFRLLYGNPLPVVQWLRNTGMSGVDGVRPMKSLMMAYALGTAGDRPQLAQAAAF